MLSLIVALAVIVAAANVPVSVGPADRTMLPEPVTLDPRAVATPVPNDVMPVPPEATGSVPVVRTDVEVA